MMATRSKSEGQKSVRFSKIVEDAGQPEMAVLWQDPKKNSGFQSALHQNRVMTVQLKHAGATSDFGMVGFKQSPHAEYLVFPRPLHAFADKRIVGIKYDLISSPKPRGPALKAAKKVPSSRKKLKTGPPPRRELVFRVEILHTAVIVTSEEVEAPSA